ncbi:5-oxoprolinase subunit B family protein [Streptomyces californicus]|uniref:5-oxoprolinase subunit B family protein n=1 Tax=Streptomyces californicus TaxID=67351 RepID=UPI0035B411F2
MSRPGNFPSCGSGSGGAPRVLAAGPHALLVELADGEHAEAFHAELILRRERGELPAVRDIVPAARTVLLDGIADRDPGARDRLARDLASWRVEPVSRAGGDPVEIPVVYDGPDLDAVAALWGVGADEVGALHSRTAFRVAFCGFAPGFGYLAGLPERLHVPRRTTPRTRVPAGAVALAGPYTGVYPRPSPGGWQLIGRMPDPAALWDPEREPAALLGPGTPVRFVPVGEGGGPHAGAVPEPRGRTAPAPLGGAASPTGTTPYAGAAHPTEATPHAGPTPHSGPTPPAAGPRADA